MSHCSSSASLQRYSPGVHSRHLLRSTLQRPGASQSWSVLQVGGSPSTQVWRRPSLEQRRSPGSHDSSEGVPPSPPVLLLPEPPDAPAPLLNSSSGTNSMPSV